MFDIVLNNGMLIDPKNSIMSYLNIGIENGIVSSLSTEKLEGIKEYDCEGKIVSPGFVDMHMHEDPLNVSNEGFDICISECMLKMGVTTVIGGNCGIGPLSPLNYLAMVEKIGYPVNIGLLSSHENLESVRNNHPDYLVVAHVMKESEVDMALCHPRSILASDGILNDGNGHPRAAGTFPRFIKEYVIKKKSISLFEAVNKMTYLPAKRMNISKGALSIGDDADIVVFDINTICDNSTFKEPLKSPSGIDYVFIRGDLALKDGVIYNSTLGKPVRR